MERDRLGRRRQPNQERGLRPLHPPLPREWISKAIRVAMPREDWSRFEAMVQRTDIDESTLARANGIVLSRMIHATTTPPGPGPLDWMDWERMKTLRLLRSAV
jgi:hypothetical protein